MVTLHLPVRARDFYPDIRTHGLKGGASCIAARTSAESASIYPIRAHSYSYAFDRRLPDRPLRRHRPHRRGGHGAGLHSEGLPDGPRLNAPVCYRRACGTCIMKANNKAGFTLIELLIVVAIIGIIAAIAVLGCCARAWQEVKPRRWV